MEDLGNDTGDKADKDKPENVQNALHVLTTRRTSQNTILFPNVPPLARESSITRLAKPVQNT
jgi:hypothetical protein